MVDDIPLPFPGQFPLDILYEIIFRVACGDHDDNCTRLTLLSLATTGKDVSWKALDFLWGDYQKSLGPLLWTFPDTLWMKSSTMFSGYPLLASPSKIVPLCLC